MNNFSEKVIGLLQETVVQSLYYGCKNDKLAKTSEFSDVDELEDVYNFGKIERVQEVITYIF